LKILSSLFEVLRLFYAQKATYVRLITWRSLVQIQPPQPINLRFISFHKLSKTFFAVS